MPLKPYLQLARFPNLFTAAADSLAGWLLVGGSLGVPRNWLPLVAASVCVYAGGVVLNDVFDIEVDRTERPNRPLPSGRVAFQVAAWLGSALLVAGIALAALSGTPYALAVSVVLVGCVLAYDAGLKRTVLGPEAMGACRGLNVLFGMSASPVLGGPYGWLVAVAYGVFVCGITWISRSEVHHGLRKNVALGMVLQDAGVAGLLVACAGANGFPYPSVRGQVVVGIAALLLVALSLNRVSIAALREPEPRRVQRAVKTGILSLVWLHVALLASVRGPIEALAVGWLWLPAAFAGRWVYMT
jgi:4-hydroxybenzoate polyprenyltransferase